MAPNDMSDHDLLIRIDERTEKLDMCMTNHLRHHWAVTLAAVGAVISAVVAMIVSLVVATASRLFG
ncbi:MAG TPA: hypothetical protein VMW52_11675 [Phycisphaerae bacterium]|nr:hypothetical protein [Phycisphaerae bacterium]